MASAGPAATTPIPSQSAVARAGHGPKKLPEVAVMRRRGRQAVLGSLFAIVTGLVFAGPASADPVTVTEGPRTLEASAAEGLDPAGQKVTVEGAGYDEAKGIYVAFCVDTGPGNAPTPCLGGIDMEGTTGGSVWVSSNPPPYGEGLAVPYNAGGSFKVSLNVAAVDEINGIDCREVQCVIVSRNDHTRSGDRSQDVRIPVTFAKAGEPAPSAESTPTAPSSEPATTAAATSAAEVETSTESAEPSAQEPTRTVAEPTESGAGSEAAITGPATSAVAVQSSTVESSRPAPSSQVASSQAAPSPQAASPAASSPAAEPSDAAVAPVAGVESTSNTGWIVGLIVVVVFAAGVIFFVRRRAGRTT